MNLQRRQGPVRGAISRFINLNIVPPELRPPQLGLLDLALIVVTIVGLLLLVFLYLMQSRNDRDAARLRLQLSQTTDTLSKLTTTGTASQKLDAALQEARKAAQSLQSDYGQIAAARVSWSKVLDAIRTSAPPGLAASSVVQEGSALTITVSGTAADEVAVVEYADRLLASGVLARPPEVLSINETLARAPGGAQTPFPTSPGGTQPPAGPGQIPGLGTATPTSLPGLPPGPIVPPAAQPTRTSTSSAGLATPPAGIPGPPTPVSGAGTPTPTVPIGLAGTPTPTRTPTVTASPTKAVDYTVVSKVGTFSPEEPNNIGNSAAIFGRVIDQDGNLIPGLRFRIESCCPTWSAITPGEGQGTSDGRFGFAISKSTFTVTVLSGVSEPAGGLFTGITDVAGVTNWDITFQKTKPGSPPPPLPTSTSGPTLSPTRTETVTPTPTATIADPDEPNDTRATAGTLTTGVLVNSRISSPTDIDYYKFTVGQVGNFIKADLTNLLADFDLYLEDPGGFSLRPSTNTGTTSESVSWTAAAVGTYYLRVEGKNGAVSAYPYQLVVNVTVPTATPAPIPDIYEGSTGNDTCDNATPAYTNSFWAVVWPPGDVDYYKVTSPRGTPFSASLVAVPIDLKLTLEDTNGISLAISDNSGTASEVVTRTITLAPSEILCVVVAASIPGQSAPNSQYKLVISNIAPAAVATESPTNAPGTTTAMQKDGGTPTPRPTDEQVPPALTTLSRGQLVSSGRSGYRIEYLSMAQPAVSPSPKPIVSGSRAVAFVLRLYVKAGGAN